MTPNTQSGIASARARAERLVERLSVCRVPVELVRDAANLVMALRQLEIDSNGGAMP